MLNNFWSGTYDSVSGSIAKFDRQINEDMHLAELMRKIDNIINEQTWPFFL